MITSDQFFIDLRSALNHLYDPYFLRKSPLIKVFGLESRPDAPAELQRILNEAIAALEPASNERLQGQRRKNFELIMYRYVQQFGQEEIAAQMGLSVRHLRREQNVAVYDLAALLWNQYNLDARPFQMDTPGDEIVEPNPDPQNIPADASATGGTIAGSSTAAHGQDAFGAGAQNFASLETSQPPAENDDLGWLKDLPMTAPAALGEVLVGVLDLMQPLAARYAVQVQVDIAPELPGLAVQEVALRQVLLNILSVVILNHERGQVKIAARAAEADSAASAAVVPQVLVTISGIAASLAEAGSSIDISAKEALSEDEQGALGMAERILALYGGSMDRPHDPRGCTLALLLPVFGQRSVLVIDDNIDFIQLVTRSLTGTRYTVTGERSPQNAVDAVLRAAPDMVLLDVMMPGLDGWEVLARLRRHPGTTDIPVIICTILPQEELALSLGASGFLRKPVTSEQILSVLDRQPAIRG